MHLSLGRMFSWGICHKEQNARELGRKLPPSKVEIAAIYCSEKKKLEFRTVWGGQECSKHLSFSFRTTGEVPCKTGDKLEADRALSKQQNQLNFCWIEVIHSHSMYLASEEDLLPSCQSTAFSSFRFGLCYRQLPHPWAQRSQEGPHPVTD